jgi:hypothetical protein
MIAARTGGALAKRVVCTRTDSCYIAGIRQKSAEVGKMAKREFAHPNEMHKYVGQ